MNRKKERWGKKHRKYSHEQKIDVSQKLKIQHLLSKQNGTNYTILSAWWGPSVDRVDIKRHKEYKMAEILNAQIKSR